MPSLFWVGASSPWSWSLWPAADPWTATGTFVSSPTPALSGSASTIIWTGPPGNSVLPQYVVSNGQGVLEDLKTLTHHPALIATWAFGSASRGAAVYQELQDQANQTKDKRDVGTQAEGAHLRMHSQRDVARHHNQRGSPVEGLPLLDNERPPP